MGRLPAPCSDVRVLLVSFTADTGFVTVSLHLDSMLYAVFLSHVWRKGMKATSTRSQSPVQT